MGQAQSSTASWGMRCRGSGLVTVCYPFAFLSAGIPRGFRLSFTCKKFKINASNLSKSSFKRVRSLGK